MCGFFSIQSQNLQQVGNIGDVQSRQWRKLQTRAVHPEDQISAIFNFDRPAFFGPALQSYESKWKPQWFINILETRKILLVLS